MRHTKWVKQQSHTSWKAFKWGVAITISLLVLIVLLCSFYAGPRDYNGSVPGSSRGSVVPVQRISRPVFRYSVIPGGVDSGAEMQEYASGDYVVRALYNSMNFALVHEHRFKADIFVYVSYRKGQQVFWTKDTHVILAEERTFTDGRLLVRARCGNLLSFTPRYPTENVEPTTEEFSSVQIDQDPGATVTPMLRSALSLTAPPAPRFVLGDLGGGRSCRHEDDGDDDDCKHKHGPSPAPVPEPTTLVLLGTGMIAVFAAAKRRRKA